MSEGRHEYRQQTFFKKHLLQLYVSQKDCDVLLTLPNSAQTFGAHTSVLAVRCHQLASPIRSFLCAKGKHNSSTSGFSAKHRVRLPHVSTFTVDRTLRYVYTGSLQFPSIENTEISPFLRDLLILASFLGIPSLRTLVFRLIDERLPIRILMVLLDDALCSGVLSSQDVIRLTESFCEKSASFQDVNNIEGKSTETYSGLSETFWRHVLRTEPLQMSEDKLWSLLVQRACAQLGISFTPASQMTPVEQILVKERVIDYCQPGMLRLLSFSTPFFAREVEPLEAYPSSEVLLKYKFDATVGTQPFNHTYPHDRLSFLKRVRQSAVTIESNEHPHKKGVREDRQICMASWASQVAIVVDSRTALGKYAQLELFTDDTKAERFFFLRGTGPPVISMRKPTSSTPHSFMRRESQGPSSRTVESVHSELSCPIILDANKFYLSFYSPLNVGDTAWGYKLTVTNLR